MSAILSVTRDHVTPCCHFIDFMDGDIERTAVFCEDGGKFLIDGMECSPIGSTLGRVIDRLNVVYGQATVKGDGDE